MTYAVPDAPAALAVPSIEVRNLTMRYGSLLIMEELSFSVVRGEVFVIMGGSGSGKSTLLKHLIGLKQPAEERQARHGTVRHHDPANMLHEVQVDLKGPVAMGERPRGQPTGGHVLGDVPPMIHRRGQCELDLADDLRPHVERVDPRARRWRGLAARDVPHGAGAGRRPPPLSTP